MKAMKSRHKDGHVKFPLGKVAMTKNAYNVLDPIEVESALARHATGDWGDVSPKGRIANERGLAEGDQLVSVFHLENSREFYIITALDRGMTFIFFPEDCD